MVDYTDPNWPNVVRAREKEKERLRKETKTAGKGLANRTWRTYSMTLEDITDLHTAQEGRCANVGCRVKIQTFGKTRAVDHDHKTGNVRGMLCKNCNLALGLVLDKPKVLEGLIDYLVRGNAFASDLLLERLTDAQRPAEQRAESRLFERPNTIRTIQERKP